MSSSHKPFLCRRQLPRVRELQMCTKPLLKHLQVLRPFHLSVPSPFFLEIELTENQCQSVLWSLILSLLLLLLPGCCLFAACLLRLLLLQLLLLLVCCCCCCCLFVAAACLLLLLLLVCCCCCCCCCFFVAAACLLLLLLLLLVCCCCWAAGLLGCLALAAAWLRQKSGDMSWRSCGGCNLVPRPPPRYLVQATPSFPALQWLQTYMASTGLCSTWVSHRRQLHRKGNKAKSI